MVLSLRLQIQSPRSPVENSKNTFLSLQAERSTIEYDLIGGSRVFEKSTCRPWIVIKIYFPRIDPSNLMSKNGSWPIHSKINEKPVDFQWKKMISQSSILNHLWGCHGCFDVSGNYILKHYLISIKSIQTFATWNFLFWL